MRGARAPARQALFSRAGGAARDRRYGAPCGAGQARDPPERRRLRQSFDLALFGAGNRPSRQGLRMPQTLNDLRFGLRVLLKDRSYTATVLLTLAICIGANAAIF